MGTPKRERQKANRQQRLEELARQARTVQRKRKGMYLLLIPVGALALYGIVKLVGDDDGAASSSSTTLDAFAESSTSLDPLATTTLDPNAPTTTVTPLPSTIAGATLTGETPCPAADGTSPPKCLMVGAQASRAARIRSPKRTGSRRSPARTPVRRALSS